MSYTPTAEWKQLRSELELAQRAFDTSHARLSRTLAETEAGKKPPRSLRQSLQQHLTAAACLLAMGRAVAQFRRLHPEAIRSAIRNGGRHLRGPSLTHA